LTRKFHEKKDLYLSRATCDADWERTRSFHDLNLAVKSLALAGVKIDEKSSEPTRLAKNKKY